MNRSLKNIIIEEIKKTGPISFSKFMELCLYHPEYGYYRKDNLPIGKSGDFYTSPCVHSIFGHTIAKQFIEFISEIGEKDIYLIEAGAGRGHLAADIGQYLTKKNFKVKLIIIEPHNPFRDIQYKQVKDFYKEVVFLNNPSELPLLNGIFYCNELFDSFPVEIIENREGSLRQVYVSYEREVFFETLLPISKEVSEFLTENDLEIPDGFRTEISPLSLNFYRELLKNIRKGISLIIDYGYTKEEFFEPHRKKGTLMCYKKHLADEDPYEMVGEKDITAHVNFSLLSSVGANMGFKIAGYTDQQYFLLGAGILEEMEMLKEEISQKDYEQEIQKIKNLIMDSMGKTFKFLCQTRGIEKENFVGFSMRDYKKWL